MSFLEVLDYHQDGGGYRCQGEQVHRVLADVACEFAALLGLSNFGFSLQDPCILGRRAFHMSPLPKA